MNQFSELIHKLRLLSDQSSKPLLIAIDGIRGSGKSTLANQITQELEGTVISLDDFRSKEVYEVDRERLTNQLLIPLRNREIAKYQKWLWGENKLSDLIEVKSNQIIIFEGVTALHPELIHYYNFKIWININEDKAFKQGLNRDRNEYGVDTEKEWITQWIPYEQEYIQKYNPQESADFIYNII